jgi:hypothetical protein
VAVAVALLARAFGILSELIDLREQIAHSLEAQFSETALSFVLLFFLVAQVNGRLTLKFDKLTCCVCS